MESVRLAHGSANDINVRSLDFEGAYNLLRTWDNYVDINNDGQYKIGLGNSRVFPPTGAPAGVWDAWNQAVSGINQPEGIKAIISRAPFLAAEMGANIKYDPNGKPIGVYQPDDPEYINIYTQPGFTYQGMLDMIISDLENNKPPGMSEEYYSATRDLFRDFKTGLVENNIA